MDIEEVNEKIQQAIEDKLIVRFSYKWRTRVVEPYLIGVHEEEDELMLRGFQTEGESESGGLPDWRLFRLTKISGLKITKQEFEPRREIYEPNDPDMKEVVHRI
jgi:predicted DNA-binding transcriptional regulator YafY